MNNFMFRMMNFFRGRYGTDQLNIVLMIGGFVVEILGRILRNHFIYYIGLAMFLLMLFRSFSKNIPARQRENEKFMYFFNRFRNWRYFRQQKKNGTYTYNKSEQERGNKRGTVYAYYYCPECKQQVRVPAGKGKIRIVCPKCGNKFETYS